MGALRVATAIAAGVVLLGGAVSGAIAATARVEAPTPPLDPLLEAASTWRPAPGQPPSVPLPGRGSLAVDAVAGTTTTPLAAFDATTPRPIASVAKTMTALVVLETRPLAPGVPGPVLTMTAEDVADYVTVAAEGGSYLRVELGERLSERDLLLGLMLPSANNLALTLARWIDGSVPAFVARLNARAAALGLAHTHFADPDGLDPATTSTAADLAVLGEAAVADQALVSIVSTPRATLPDGAVINNLDTLLTQEPGWIGVKTGWTPAAGGCLLFAARRTLIPGAPALTIAGAVLDQAPDAGADLAHPELGGAFRAARAAVEAAFAGYAAVALDAGSLPVGAEVSAPWGAASLLRLDGGDHVVLLRRGDTLALAARAQPVAVPSAAGATAGWLTVSREGVTVARWRLVTTGRLGAPAPWWTLLHG